jgi:hypothetical protein
LSGRKLSGEIVMRVNLAFGLSFLLLGACSTLVPPSPRPDRMAARPAGAELIGQSLRLQTANGQVSTLRFADNGVVRAQFGSQEIAGTWVATGTQLCFSWSGTSRECWPYAQPLVRGETATLTSDRGNVVKVTLQ